MADQASWPPALAAGGPPVAFQLVSPSGSDDAAQITAAIAAAVTAGQANGSNYGEVWFAGNAGPFMVTGAQVKGGATLGNAQIPLPVIPATGEKFTLVLRGVRDASANPHWLQTIPQKSGAVLVSTAANGNDGTFGYPSVIGGPTPQQLGATDGGFSNMLVVVDGLALVVPFNPSQIGFDFRCCAGAGVPTAAVLANGTAVDFSGQSGNFTNGCIGLYLPALNNNDYCEVGAFTAYGLNYAVGFADHTNVKRLAAIYCNTALFLNSSSGAKSHGARFGYLSIEDCQIGVDATLAPAGGPYFPLVIDLADFELHHAQHIKDPNNALCGVARLADESEALSIQGAANLHIENPYQPRGATAAPGVPATTVALTNPFWRDAAVTVHGGTVTVIAVDGTATGVTSGTVIVPSGKTITLTYSVLPAWTWVLL
jgi:hypothetical protein